jgi:hypothetical protein
MATFQTKSGDSYLDLAKGGDIQLGMITQGDIDIVFRKAHASEAYSPRAHQTWQQEFGIVSEIERRASVTNRGHCRFHQVTQVQSPLSVSG